MNHHPTTSGSTGDLNSISQQQILIRIASGEQPPPPPVALNLPRPDLLVGRRDYNEILVPSYKATITGDWKAAKNILDKRPELVRFSITESCETVLHIAVLGKSYWFVEYLVSLMEKKDLELQNVNGQTALCLAAMAGHVKIAKILVKKNLALLDIPDSQGMMPLHMAALYGKHDMVKYLYQNSQRMTGDFWTHQNRADLLVKSVESNLFDVALQIVTDRPELAVNGHVLGLLARKPYAFDAEAPNITRRLKCWLCHMRVNIPSMESHALQLLRIIWAEIVKLPKVEIDDILRGPPDQTEGDEKQTHAEKKQQEMLLLLRTISENIAKMPAKICNIFRGPTDEKMATKKDAKPTYSSRVLFLAAEIGNTAFVVEVIRQYPHLVREVNDKNQSIFHIAVSHRHEGIYNMLYDIGSLRNLIITLEDKNGNNLLHLAGESPKINRLENIPGVGLQLHLETLWFKEVEAMLPPPFREKKNAAGLTPHEVFRKEHKELFSKGEEWIKETAGQLMVVASLIATISFAAAFTFPGGYDQVTGMPIFLRKDLSKTFIIFDGLSFITATTSILMVLCILGSDYTEHDFMISLPQQLMICLASLFISITTMILTFIINFFLLYQNNSQWIPIFIICFAVVTYVIFGSPKFPLVGRFLYGSRFLFQRGPLFSPSQTKLFNRQPVAMTKEVEVAEHHSGKDYHDPPPAPLIDAAELTKWSFYRALIAEFVATLLFLYVTVLTVIGYKSTTDPDLDADQCGGVGILGIAWAFGGMIFILVYCTAGISGGHINPAVTFGLFLARKVSLIRAIMYMVAQCLGAICGVGLVKAFQSAYYDRYGGGANTLADGYSKGTGLGAEIIGTFVLVYTVFSATDPKRNARDSHVPVLAPLPIGFAVFMVHLATIPITGTGINPARSFGAAVIYNDEKAWDDHWLFWVGPFLGAAAAAFYHQFVLRAAAAKALGSFRSNA